MNLSNKYSKMIDAYSAIYFWISSEKEYKYLITIHLLMLRISIGDYCINSIVSLMDKHFYKSLSCMNL